MLYHLEKKERTDLISECILRLAAHDLMDYYENNDGSTKGGPDGCLDFNDSANFGLFDCLINSDL